MGETMEITETKIKETIFKLLKNIAPESSPEALGTDDDVRETLEIDSYDFLNFMIGLNEEFGVEIPETDYGKLITLNDMIYYILARAKS
jgi:acyl carrier protein